MLDITYEAGYDEALHPDPTINAQMEEIGVSNCTHGCKIYGLSKVSGFRVLGHAASYGCTRDSDAIRAGV